MKREFITDVLPDIAKEHLDAIMEENGKDIEAAKAKFADYDSIKTQLSEANAAIDRFKALDVDGIKQAAEDWKIKYEAEMEQGAQKLADLEFNTLIDGMVGTAKGKSTKAIRALLDIDTLKGSKNQTEDIKKALDELKTQSDYLFESAEIPPPYAAGTGTGGAGKYSPQECTLRSAMGLKTED